MIDQFADLEGGFFDTPHTAETVLLRPKDIQDNATPSGNALAADALLKMAAYTENQDWRERAEQSLGLVARLAPQYPTAFGRWLSAADFAQQPTRQIALIGDLTHPQMAEFLLEIRRSGTYRPNTVVAAAGLPLPEGSPALLHDRPMLDGKATAYVCEGFVCKRPVNSVMEFRKQLADDES